MQETTNLIMEEEVKKEKIKEAEIMDLPGVGAATAEKLREAGFRNVMSLAVSTPGQLIEAGGFTEGSARKVINAAREQSQLEFTTGEEILEKRKEVKKLSTGSLSFDEMLGGGIETASITECFGEFGSGKTQIGQILAVNTIKQFPESHVVYIDTENTFRPERIEQLARGAGVNAEEVLKRIFIAKAYNSDHQMLLSEKVEELIADKKMDVKLVVVDSLTSQFRAEFIGRGTLSERQQKLNKHMNTLKKLGQVYNMAIYVTNQVMAKPDMFFGDPTAAIGGNIVGHNSTFRIYLRKGKKGSRVAKLIDSPNLPESECNFFVKEEGLEDV